MSTEQFFEHLDASAQVIFDLADDPEAVTELAIMTLAVVAGYVDAGQLPGPASQHVTGLARDVGTALRPATALGVLEDVRRNDFHTARVRSAVAVVRRASFDERLETLVNAGRLVLSDRVHELYDETRDDTPPSRA